MIKTICSSAHSIPLPYLGLRSYSGEQLIDWPTVRYSPLAGLPAIEIAGCDPDCDHEWVTAECIRGTGGKRIGSSDGKNRRQIPVDSTTGQYCQKCGGWRGGLGQEPSIEMFIGHLILCLREWHRVLRDDGSCFVNLGDSYANDAKWGGQTGGKHCHELHGTDIGRGRKATGLKPKNLCLVPERFRLAAQADGWIVRSQFPWLKASALPESTKDRPSNNLESWVMRTKGQRYYWDSEAIMQEAVAEPTRNRRTGDWLSLDQAIIDARRWIAHAELIQKYQGLALDMEGQPLAMLVNPRPFAGAHSAAFPPGVVEPLILAGTSQHGVCAKCGAPHRRIIESKPALAADGKTCTKCGKNHGKPKQKKHDLDGAQDSHMADYMASDVFVCVERSTVGWEPSCNCNADLVPATVLDPFVGSGTVLEVATALARDGIGVDISQDYLDNVLPMRFADGVQIGFQF